MHTQDNQSEPDLTPMLDVVFIMLIFFIVTATFVKEQGLDLPGNDEAKTPTSANQSAVLDISATNRYQLNGKPIDFRALKNRLAAYHAEYPDQTLVVRADPKADTEQLVFAMDCGYAVGMTVALAAAGSL